MFTEAWHSNRPKTEQEIIDEITSKTTSEVVKRSILDGVGKWKGLSLYLVFQTQLEAEAMPLCSNQVEGVLLATGHVNNIPTMQFFTGISRNTQSKTYMLSLTECVWDFQNIALWDIL